MTASLVRGADGVVRCAWAGGDPLGVAYHDAEWGTAERDEARLFELLTLELFQSGLSWSTILRKREAFRRAFAGFDAEAIARFDADDVARLLADPGIVRHRGKIEATIANARAVLAVASRGEALAAIVWGAAPTRRVRPRTVDEIPARTAESAALARTLREQGFRFLGPTTAYALMQAAGVVDDHIAGCFRSA